MKSASDILESTKDIFSIYKKSLLDYSEEVFNFKKQDDIWSLAEMYEHVCTSGLKFFAANTRRCLEQRNGQEGGESNTNWEGIKALGEFPDIKIKVPEAAQSIIITKPKNEYFKMIEDIILAAENLMEGVEKDSGIYKINHPVFGFLNAHEWYMNLEIHSKHHLRQKATLESYAGA
jgi:hypothetical protein